DRDAKLAAAYFERVLGVPERNLALLTGDHAAKGDFEKYFERWLPNRVADGGRVYVYYSGHGAPNPKTGDAYLVPWDADPTYIDQTGYPVKRLYAQLAKLPAARTTVVLDSCFSGAGGRSVIARGARPLVTVATDAVPPRLTVISASAGDQISNSDPEKGHGLFTYYFLKGLKTKGPDLRAVFDYLKPQVQTAARRDDNSDQDPQWREGR
ncbi:MAG: caspase family protein, partial [Elusimicrobia bacterium]|nr:caspase family protein [Elusimicrobiota bacterium]